MTYKYIIQFWKLDAKKKTNSTVQKLYVKSTAELWAIVKELKKTDIKFHVYKYKSAMKKYEYMITYVDNQCKEVVRFNNFVPEYYPTIHCKG